MTADTPEQMSPEQMVLARFYGAVNKDGLIAEQAAHIKRLQEMLRESVMPSRWPEKKVREG